MSQTNSQLKRYLMKQCDKLVDNVIARQNSNYTNESAKDESSLTITTSTENASNETILNQEKTLDMENIEQLHSDDSKEDNKNNNNILPHVIGSLLNASIEKIKITDDEIINDDAFVDIFLDKLISKLLIGKLPEREHLHITHSHNQPTNMYVNGSPLDDITQRLEAKSINNDITTQDMLENYPVGNSQNISATKLARNFKRLSKKMEHVFVWQDKLIRLLNWKSPTHTIIALIIMTIICYSPMYLLLLPILSLMYCVIIPNLKMRYPLYTTLLDGNHRTNKMSHEIGNSLLLDLSKPDRMSDHSIISEDLSDQYENSSKQFFINLRDTQEMTTNTLELIDKISNFINVKAAFQDELVTTKLFIKCFSIYISLKLLSPFINWSLTISILMWLSVIHLHPGVYSKMSQYRITRLRKDRNDNHDPKPTIIIDNKPQIKYVQIFEIYRQGLLPNTWVFFLYSNNIFHPMDEFRKSQRRPPGVKQLIEVEPPMDGWSFDSNSEWEIDYNVEIWAKNYKLDLNFDNEFQVDNMFKRRRLTRKIIK